MPRITHAWMETLMHLYALAGEGTAGASDTGPARPVLAETRGAGEAFIDPRKATRTGYLASHMNHAGEPVDLFRDSCGCAHLVTNHGDGTMTVEVVRYAGKGNWTS